MCVQRHMQRITSSRQAALLAASLTIAATLAGCGDADVPADTAVPATASDEQPDATGDAAGGTSLAQVTVGEALTLEPPVPVAVRGYLHHDDGGMWRVCDVLAESMPPQCPGAHLTVVNPDVIGADIRDALQSANGVGWSDGTTVVTGQRVGAAGIEVGGIEVGAVGDGTPDKGMVGGDALAPPEIAVMTSDEGAAAEDAALVSAARQPVLDYVAAYPGSGYVGTSVDAEAQHVTVWWKGPVPPAVTALAEDLPGEVQMQFEQAPRTQEELLTAFDRIVPPGKAENQPLLDEGITIYVVLVRPERGMLQATIGSQLPGDAAAQEALASSLLTELAGVPVEAQLGEHAVPLAGTVGPPT